MERITGRSNRCRAPNVQRRIRLRSLGLQHPHTLGRGTCAEILEQRRLPDPRLPMHDHGSDLPDTRTVKVARNRSRSAALPTGTTRRYPPAKEPSGGSDREKSGHYGGSVSSGPEATKQCLTWTRKVSGLDSRVSQSDRRAEADSVLTGNCAAGSGHSGQTTQRGHGLGQRGRTHTQQDAGVGGGGPQRAAKAASTTAARSPAARPGWKRCAGSSAGSLMPSPATSERGDRAALVSGHRAGRLGVGYRQSGHVEEGAQLRPADLPVAGDN